MVFYLVLFEKRIFTNNILNFFLKNETKICLCGAPRYLRATLRNFFCDAEVRRDDAENRGAG